MDKDQRQIYTGGKRIHDINLSRKYDVRALQYVLFALHEIEGDEMAEVQRKLNKATTLEDMEEMLKKIQEEKPEGVPMLPAEHFSIFIEGV